MKCPECGSENNSWVVESRGIPEAIRRRRECYGCQKRFTTIEVIAPSGSRGRHSTLTLFQQTVTQKSRQIAVDVESLTRQYLKDVANKLDELKFTEEE